MKKVRILIVAFDGLEPALLEGLPTFRRFLRRLTLLRSVPGTMTQKAWAVREAACRAVGGYESERRCQDEPPGERGFPTGPKRPGKMIERTMQPKGLAQYSLLEEDDV